MTVSVAWRRVGTSCLAVCCVLLGGLLLSGAPALALSQRGHVFVPNSSFGSKGAGSGQLEKPAGVAVNEATGDVYVVDRANNRIAEWKPTFNSNGEFIKADFVRAWGWGVADGKAEPEVCTSSCQAGISGGGKGQLISPEAIAVDNSTSGSDPSRGDVYVVSKGKKNSISKFGPNGEYIGRLKAEVERAFDGVAVDPSGKVWIYQVSPSEEPGEIESFSNAKNNILEAETGPLEVLETEPRTCLARAKPGFAVGLNDESFYVNHERELGFEECGEEEGAHGTVSVAAKVNAKGEAAVNPLDGENTTALAVDLASSDASERGDVYIDNATSVMALDAGGSLIQRFGSGALEAGSGIAIDSSTKAVYVADSSTAADRVVVFTPEPAGPPTVDSLSAQNLTTTETELKAQIDPHGAATTYAFQYATTPISGAVSCTGGPASCTEVPVPPGQLPAGFGAQGVSVTLQGLQPGTLYYYRVIASNEHGNSESAQTVNTFTSLPTSAGVLPDGRAWEMVSPPEKFGGGIEIPIEGGLIQASEDGSAIAYVANGPIVASPEGNRSIEPTPIMSTRGSKEWESQEIETPHGSASGISGGSGSEYRFFSPDLALSVVEPFGRTKLAEPPLSPPALNNEVQESTLYLRDDAPIAPQPSEAANYSEAKTNGELEAEIHGAAAGKPGYLPLVTAANDTAASQFGGGLKFLDATPDLSHSVIESALPLTSQPAPEGSLYEWSAGQLQLVSILPEEKGEAGKAAAGAFLGDRGLIVRNATSSDGSRIFWENNAEENLYMRDTAAETTIQVNAPQGVPPEEHGIVRFQTANSDGSRVFFTDTARLTSESTLQQANRQNAPADLYEFDLKSGKLIDLTVDKQFKENAAVQGVVIGVDKGGSAVYFVANGILAPGATVGHCVSAEEEEGGVTPQVGATCNLYVSRYDEKAETWTPTFIAALSNEDSPDWTAGPRISGAAADLGGLTSRVSLNGEHLAFMSNMRLTGYENKDAVTHEPDEEVFLYEAKSGNMVCASCDPSGAPPVGVRDTPEANGGLGLLVDQLSVWEGHRLAGNIPGWTAVNGEHALYQSRYLSDTGRLFFNSPDPLVSVPQETNKGTENVYEYEPNGEGGCHSSGGCVALISSGTSTEESAFLDASVSGNDAFFLTSAQLLPQDRDTSFDVYDAHVCTGASPCLKPPPPPSKGCGTAASCNSTGTSSPPTFGAPGSVTFSGPGNVAAQQTLPYVANKPQRLTRAQKLTKALKACRKKANKKKRATCVSRAKKQYGPKKASKSSKKGRK